MFVCEHGNVKSLMAASYFNQLAAQRGLPWRAVARGIAPDSTTVPELIAAALRADGVDVSEFRPAKVDATDAAEAARIVMIGTDLPRACEATSSASNGGTTCRRRARATMLRAARSKLTSRSCSNGCRYSRPAGNRIVAINPLGLILRQRQPTFVPLGDGPHDRETQAKTAAVSLACGRQAFEWLDCASPLVLGNTRPFVRNCDLDEARLDPQRDTRTRRRT